VALLGALVAPGALAKVDGKMVPLKGSFEGAGTEFAGNFSHLGLFEGVVVPGTPDLSEFPIIVIPSTATWTAANGDTVTNSAELRINFFCLISAGDCPYSQEFTITGGTGRFMNATGSATATGTLFADGSYDGYLDGTISQPDKKK
jgi:hypothetical protein